MSAAESRRQLSTEGAVQLMELIETALVMQSTEELVEHVLPGVARMMGSGSVSLYVADSRLPAPHFFQQGLQPEAASEVENLCVEQFDRISSQAAPEPGSVSTDLTFYPLRAEGGCVGLIGLTAPDDASPIPPELLERLFRLLAATIDRLAERTKSERQLALGQLIGGLVVGQGVTVQETAQHVGVGWVAQPDQRFGVQRCSELVEGLASPFTAQLSLDN